MLSRVAMCLVYVVLSLRGGLQTKAVIQASVCVSSVSDWIFVSAAKGVSSLELRFQSIVLHVWLNAFQLMIAF